MTTILLVEDDRIIRRIVQLRLEKWQYQVIMAEDGDTAVSHALAHHPDLILMDMRLPVLDGWQATAQIKANPSTADIPIIAMSAIGTQDEIKQCYEAGCVAVITKPVEFSKLEAILTQYLPQT